MRFSAAKLYVLLAIFAGVVALFGYAHFSGRQAEAQKELVEEAGEAVAASEANTRVATASAGATDRVAREAIRLEREAANASRIIDAATEPAPGTVGARALVDPELGRALVCSVRRLRGDPEAAAPQCAAALPDIGQPSR